MTLDSFFNFCPVPPNSNSFSDFSCSGGPWPWQFWGVLVRYGGRPCIGICLIFLTRITYLGSKEITGVKHPSYHIMSISCTINVTHGCWPWPSGWGGVCQALYCEGPPSSLTVILGRKWLCTVHIFGVGSLLRHLWRWTKFRHTDSLEQCLARGALLNHLLLWWRWGDPLKRGWGSSHPENILRTTCKIPVPC